MLCVPFHWSHKAWAVIRVTVLFRLFCAVKLSTYISLSFCRPPLQLFLNDLFTAWMLVFTKDDWSQLCLPNERMHYWAIIVVCLITVIKQQIGKLIPPNFSTSFSFDFLFTASMSFCFFIAGKILVFITVYVPKWITVSPLNTVKYCEENTAYLIFACSESLSLTHCDNNYSALRRRTWIMDPILSK